MSIRSSLSDLRVGRYLEMWARDYAGPAELMVSAESGSEMSECATSWVTVEGPAAFGHLTLWESGELAVEIYEIATAEPLLRSRFRIASIAELADHLSALVEGCAAGFEPGMVAGTDGIGREAAIREPSTHRRSHL